MVSVVRGRSSLRSDSATAAQESSFACAALPAATCRWLCDKLVANMAAHARQVLMREDVLAGGHGSLDGDSATTVQGSSSLAQLAMQRWRWRTRASLQQNQSFADMRDRGASTCGGVRAHVALIVGGHRRAARNATARGRGAPAPALRRSATYLSFRVFSASFW